MNLITISLLSEVPRTGNCFELRPTGADKVFSLLKNLKAKVTALDTISVRLIQECAYLIYIPIWDISNQSIGLGIFSDDLKYARVTPLFKMQP